MGTQLTQGDGLHDQEIVSEKAAAWRVDAGRLHGVTLHDAGPVAGAGPEGPPPADIDELAATLGRPRRAGGTVAAEVAAPEPAGGVETETSNRTVTAVAGSDIEPDAQPARHGHRRVVQRVDVLGDIARARIRSRRRQPARRPLGAEDRTVPAKPRWLLAIPDAISQLENLDRQLLTRRDIERLFGVGKVRAAALMKTFGAELVGKQRTLPWTKLLQQLKKHRGRAAFRVEE